MLIIASMSLARFTYADSYRYVERVIDGDTIILDGGEKVRLIGIDTPETVHPNKPKQCYGKKASDYLKKRLESKSVRLEYDVDRYDKYGRTLAYVYRGRTFVNAKMIKKGYAIAYTKYPFKYLSMFTRYEDKAKKRKRGLWRKCKIAGN